jgi:GNAT superfamily N-acetyltransferase
MDIRRVDPADDATLAESAAVLQASDKELWPDLTGFTLVDFRAFARFEGKTRSYGLVAARSEPGAPVLGIATTECSLLDNLHAMEVTVAVHPAHRRRGVGTAIVEQLEEVARQEGRHTLNSIVDVPVALAADHPSVHFAPKVGFVPTLAGNSRHLHLPADKERIDALREEVANARNAGDYRTLTYQAPWPDDFVEDTCELLKVMSTDEPAGDEEREAEEWDATRVDEWNQLCRARGGRKITAVAQHIPSGRLVACTEIYLADDTPDQSWQLETVVHPDHRGHRLGLAVKIANLDVLAREAPDVRLIVTGNAAVNAPMIAVNDMMGFEIAGQGSFWQKQLSPTA